MNHSRFFLVRLHDGQEFLFHLARPAFVASVQMVPASALNINELAAKHPHGALTHAHNGERALLIVVHWIDEPGERAQSLMSRMGDWYFQTQMLKKNASGSDNN